VSKVAIREAGEGDADRLALVGSATFLETFAGILGGSAIVEHCKDKHSANYYGLALRSGCRAFLAEIEPDGAPVGFLLLGPPGLPGTGEGDLELKRIYLLKSLQGSGCGAELLATAVAAAEGFRRLVLGVFSGNERARQFYERNRFVPISKRQFDVGGVRYDDTVYAREIVG
jgi:GNAT superfamily N-acetyltransferase